MVIHKNPISIFKNVLHDNQKQTHSLLCTLFRKLKTFICALAHLNRSISSGSHHI